MREILFRGKDIRSGKMLTGDVSFDPDLKRAYITRFIYVEDDGDIQRDFEEYEVDPETVGQYTGLKDKNGKKIFEGDIIKSALDGINREIIFAETYWYGWYANSERYGMESLQEFEQVDGNKKPCIYFLGKIIGNIHDNPELITGEEK